jgi:hypothetical protein
MVSRFGFEFDSEAACAKYLPFPLPKSNMEEGWAVGFNNWRGGYLLNP